MPHYRAGYRAAVRAAMAGSAQFDGFTVMSAWAQNIDADTLPVFGVATPHEGKQREAEDSSARDTTVKVAVKRTGGDDLEDVLDDDSAIVEQLVLAVLDTDDAPCLLTDTQIELDGGGARRIGTLIMNFTVTAWLAEPLTGV